MRPFVNLVPRFVRPNYITAFRLLTVPVVAFLLLSESYRLGLMLFAVSAFSDALDGAVARIRGEVTRFGALFDPVADKLLIIVSAFILIGNFMELWLFYFLVFVEVLILVLALVAKYRNKIKVQSNVFGKAKMICQSLGVIAILLYAVGLYYTWLLLVSYILLIVALFLALGSLMYNRANI